MNRSNGAEHKRKRILDDEEIRALWKACAELGTFGALLKTLLLTAQRREKVSTMQWQHLVDGEWRIASEAREKTNAGNLRLPQTALAILDAQPRLAGNPHVFAGSARGRRRNKEKPSALPAFNSFSQAKAELDSKLQLPHWTLHDLRRTARSLMSRAGVRPDISERVLGHAIPGVEGGYDRHHYADEKADALQRLAALVESIVKRPQTTWWRSVVANGALAQAESAMGMSAHAKELGLTAKPYDELMLWSYAPAPAVGGVVPAIDRRCAAG